MNGPRAFRWWWGENGSIKTVGCVGTHRLSLTRADLVATRTRGGNRGRRSHGTFAGGAAGGVGDVISLSGRTVIVVVPRWCPRNERIILDVRFEIADAEVSHVVRRLVRRI